MRISIKTNIAEITKDLTRTQKKQIPFAASQTLNQLAFDLTKRQGKGEIGKATATTFDKKRGKGSTPFTQRNFFFEKSTKENLTAWVFWDIKNADYMKFQVAGVQGSQRRQHLELRPSTQANTLTLMETLKTARSVRCLKIKPNSFQVHQREDVQGLRVSGSDTAEAPSVVDRRSERLCHILTRQAIDRSFRSLQ